MGELLIRVGLKAHELAAPLVASRTWGSLQWFPSNDPKVPDVGCYMRRLTNIIEGEISVGNTSIVPGYIGATKAAMAASVGFTPDVEFEIVWDWPRPWPTWWPIGRETWRRFCLYPKNRPDLRPRAIDLAQGVWGAAWQYNRQHYGPTNMPLPMLSPGQFASVAQQDAGRLANVRTGLANRTPFHVEDTEDGVYSYPSDHAPHGPQSEAAPAGSGIYFSTGWRQNINDLRIAVLLAPCEHVRMLRYYRRDTGAPLSVDDYPGTSPDLWGGPLPETIGVPNHDPLPIPYDYAHEIRGSRRTIQLTEQLDSPMAKRSLAGIAALARMRFSERGRLPVPGYIPVNVAALQDQATKHPNSGIYGSSMGRQIGWSLFGIAQSIKKNGKAPGPMAFAAAMAQLVKTAATPAGVFQRAFGAPFPTTPGFMSMQVMEYPILAYGCVGLEIQAGGTTSTRDVFLKGLGQLYGPNTQVPLKADYGGKGPWKFTYTSDKNGPLAVLKDGEGTSPQTMGGAAHSEAACALAYYLTKDPAWLARGAIYNATYPTWQSKLAALTSYGATTIDWQAFLVAQMQGVA